MGRDIDGNYFAVGGFFNGKIVIYTKTELIDEEMNLFVKIVESIGDQLKIDGYEEIRLVKVFFIKDRKVDGFFVPEDAYAEYKRMIIYPMSVLREKGEYTMAAAFAEELCHHCFNIDDENEVKEKVAIVLRRVYPDVKIVHDWENKRIDIML